jgi:3-dehydroquinate dehydratase-2
MRVLVLNGPNLNLLGVRDPDQYGNATLAELEDRCRSWGGDLGIEVAVAQSNHEGVLIDRLHDAVGRFDGIVINPGALTHYSYSLRDAIEAIGIPTIEVHLSDIRAREAWRAISVIEEVCAASIVGEGADGYRRALVTLAEGS